MHKSVGNEEKAPGKKGKFDAGAFGGRGCKAHMEVLREALHPPLPTKNVPDASTRRHYVSPPLFLSPISFFFVGEYRRLR